MGMLGRTIRWLGVVCLLAVALPAIADSRTRGVADQALALLASGDAMSLAAMHHYPPTYTSEELETDTRAVGKGLGFLLNRFGDPRAPTLSTTAATYYEIGSTGGTNAYWASAAPTQLETLMYHADFAKLGKGFVKVDVVIFAREGKPQIKGVAFCLPQTPQSKKLVLSAMRDLLVEIGIPIPDHFDRLAEQSLQAITPPPARLGE